MAPLSPARPSKSVQPHYIPQKGFKRLQMEEQWHLSLANEGPAVTSKGELRSVILIAGYFSADFIPGVSGKMSSLRSVLWLRGWSDSPRVDMEPPKSPWHCLNSHTSPGTSTVPPLLSHPSARNCLPWCLAFLRREFYCICSTYNCAGPALSGWGLIRVRQSFDSKVLVKVIKLFETSPSLGSGASFCWSLSFVLRTRVSCRVKQNLSRIFDLCYREYYYPCPGIHFCFICSFFTARHFQIGRSEKKRNKQHYERR